MVFRANACSLTGASTRTPVDRGLLTAEVALIGAAIVVGGSATGIASVLAPAITAERSAAAEQGASLSRAGTYRAAGMLLAPGAVAVALAVAPLSAAISLVAFISALPTVFTDVWQRRRRSSG